MKKIEFKWRKTTWVYILALVIVCSLTFFFAGGFDKLMEYLSAEPIFTDTNVEVIKINETYRQEAIVFEIKRLEIGDNYTVLLFSEKRGMAMITGADLYQNGEKLKYLSAGTSTNPYEDSAIAYEPAEGFKNLELRISPITVTTKAYTFSIMYDGDTAEVEVTIDGKAGIVDVMLEDKACSASIREGLKEVLNSHIDGYPIVPGAVLLMKDGLSIHDSNYQYSKEDPPDELKIITKQVVIDGDVVIIPIS